MAKNSLVVISIEEHPELTLSELCTACHVTPEFVQELIGYGAIEPRGSSIETWRFDADHLRRIRAILRLEHDLEINHAGAALVLDLMNEMKRMQTRLEVLEKHFFSFRGF